jgi:hypothetical protein
MKRLTVIFFLIIFAGTIGFSQNFEGGVMGGLNASQVDGDSYNGYKKPGIVAGGYVIANLSRTLFAGMELKFAQKGSRNIDSLATHGQIKYIMRLNYAELPVYLGIRTGERISFLVGLSPGYLISGNEYNDYGKFVAQDQHPFNAFDLEALVGFRFKISNRIFVDLRGAYSLLPIRKQQGVPLYYWKSSQFNNLLNTSILYRLDF